MSDEEEVLAEAMAELAIKEARPPMSDMEGKLTKPQILTCLTWDEIFVPQATFDIDQMCWTWEGLIGGINKILNISQPYFSTSVIHHLVRMGCIETLRRGAAKTPSLLALRQPPTNELWQTKSSVITPSRTDVVDQQFRDVLARLGRLEETVSALVMAEMRREGA